MADGIEITAGSGTLVGADLCTVNSVANTFVPLGKVGFGGNDQFTYVSSTAGLPVAQQGTWTVALAAGSAAIGTVGVTALPAIPAGTNVIGHVIVDAAPTTAVTGTFWQTTQPVSLATLPALAAGTNVIGHVVVDSAPVTAVTGTVAISGTVAVASVGGSVEITNDTGNPIPVSGTVGVTGTFWQATQPVSAASLPLPSGASTSAKQPAIGTAGTASADVLSVQGIASMTPLKVDGSATTQPVSGTFWQATQPVSLASLPALAAGSNVIGHVVVDTAPTTAVTGTFWQATQPVSVASLPALAAGTNSIGSVNAIQAGDSIEIAGTTYSVLRAFANATASGNTQVVAATAGKKIRVLKYSLTTSAAVNVYFGTSTGGTAISSTKYLAGAGSGLGASFCPFGQFADTTAGDALQINLSATANVGVDLLYVLV